MRATGVDVKPETVPWPECPYRVRAAGLEALRQPLADNVLLAIVYGDAGDPPEVPDARRCIVPLSRLHGERAGEIWESRRAVHSEMRGGVSFSEDGEVLVVRLTVPEADLGDAERAAERLYDELLRLTAARGYPHLLRVWNYLGGINEGEGDDERYRRFTVGRYSALSRLEQFESILPAATAIGTAGGGLTVLALAGRRAGQQVENPRQLSAFRYPRVYGARSPSFSRATLLPWADGAQLLVSGTASIIGHATAHAGDPQEQLKQTAMNLQALVTQPGLAQRGFLPELFTLYLRDPDDLLPLLPLLPRYFGGAPMQVLQGDICRRELLLEVEAIYRLPRALRK